MQYILATQVFGAMRLLMLRITALLESRHKNALASKHFYLWYNKIKNINMVYTNIIFKLRNGDRDEIFRKFYV